MDAYQYDEVTGTHYPGDPVRSIRRNLATNAVSTLCFPGQTETAEWRHGTEEPEEILQISVFVTREGKITLLGDNGYFHVFYYSLVDDALTDW